MAAVSDRGTDLGRLRSLGEDVEKIGGGDEVEAREEESFDVEILGERFFATRQPVRSRTIVDDEELRT